MMQTPASDLDAVLDAALISHQAGERDGACQVYRNVLAAFPEHPRALRYLGMASFQNGNKVEAIRLLERALAVAPNDAKALSDLGRLRALGGDMRAALELFERATHADPTDADAWHNLGTALKQLGRFTAAFDALKRALALDPRRADSFLNLGNLLVDQNQVEDAIECFKRAAALDPKLAQARSSLAGELSGRGDVSEAEAVFRQAVVLNPQHAQGWFGLGRTLEDLGRGPEAEDCYRRVLELQPGQSWALGQLLGLDGADIDDALLQSAGDALAAESTSDAAQALIGYGLGKALDRRKRYDPAFSAFRHANDARRRQAGPFDAAEFEQRIERTISIFSAEFFAERKRYGIGTDLPVFIVGMPRSGTTLTEQILHSHPQLSGAGELPHLAELAVNLAQRFNLEVPWPLCATQLTDMNVHEAAHAYLERLRARTPAGALRASDKSPLNFYHLGLIALLFPNARIVHCRRNPLDTCLSIYFENFRPNQTYATDLADLAIYYRGYQRLMAHWRDVLPISMLEFDYETSVNDTNTQARELINFLGVPWDDACLKFHESRRAVQTPSRWQVRKPIYSSSVERWRYYEKHVQALIAAFPEWV